MEVFELIVDNKVTIWRRDTVTVRAENLEEALNMAESGEYDEVYDTEYLSDTEIYLNPKDTCGTATCEIMDSSGKILWSNEGNR